MSTSTEERLVSAPDNHITYVSRRADLRLVKIPRYPERGPSGQQVGETPGQVLKFVANFCFVPKEGEIELEDGRKVDAKEVLAFLERHRLLDNRDEGFWQLDPVAPVPSQEELQALTDIALEFDEDKLIEFIDQEKAGWGRSDLLETAQRALDKMRELKAKAEAAAAAEGDGGDAK